MDKNCVKAGYELEEWCDISTSEALRSAFERRAAAIEMVGLMCFEYGARLLRYFPVWPTSWTTTNRR